MFVSMMHRICNCGFTNIPKAIMLSRIKMPLAEIKRALLEVDDKSLSVDDLRAIARHIPTSDEVMSQHICLLELIQYDSDDSHSDFWRRQPIIKSGSIF